MVEAGTFEFHSHTHTHTRWDQQLAGESKIQKMREELRLSRATLSEQFHNCSDHLCWPQGYYDEDYIKIAQEAGFNVLYTTNQYGFNRPTSSGLEVYRIPVKDKPGKWLIARLQLARSAVRGRIFNRWKAYRKQRRQAKRVTRKNNT